MPLNDEDIMGHRLLYQGLQLVLQGQENTGVSRVTRGNDGLGNTNRNVAIDALQNNVLHLVLQLFFMVKL